MKVNFITIGNAIPPSVMNWAYSSAHNLRKHGYEARVFPWFAVLLEENIKLWADRFINPGDYVVFTTEYTFHGFEFDALRHASNYAKARGATIIAVERNYNLHLVPHDVDLSGKYGEDKLVDFLNSKTGKITKIPFNFQESDFVWRKEDGFMPQTTLPIEISRHCVFDCTFCNYPNRGVKWPNRNMEKVKATMDSANALFGTTAFNIMCSTFNDNKEKLKEFFDCVEGTDYEFSAFIRLDLLVKQREFWPLFKKHIRHMCFGVDTLNWETGKTVGKGYNPEKTKEWLLEVREYFDDCLLYSCVIAGMPHTPRDEPAKWIEFFKETNVLDGWHVSPLGVMDGNYEFASTFDKKLEDYGYTREPILDYESRIASNWTRSDGYTYLECLEDTVKWNESRESTPAPFGSILLRPHLSMEHIKSIKVNGRTTTLYTQEHISVLDRMRVGFWRKMGVGVK